MGPLPSRPVWPPIHSIADEKSYKNTPKKKRPVADLIKGISYKQLRRVSDCQMTQEAQRAALAALVHAISRLDTTIYCGEGRASVECREVERNSWNAHSALSDP